MQIFPLHSAEMERHERLKRARERRFRTAKEASDYLRIPYGTLTGHEAGSRGIKDKELEVYASAYRVNLPWLAFGIGPELRGQQDGRGTTEVAIMGLVGAGAEVSPEFEQVPPEGLERLNLPIAVPEEIVGFRVTGDSMLPVYRDGDAVLVWREQRLPTEALIGQEAAVRTADGRRFLKEIQRGAAAGRFNLYSHNARLIEDVEIAWAGEIYLIVRGPQLGRLLRHAPLIERSTDPPRVGSRRTKGGRR